jgi:hypothetical protein
METNSHSIAEVTQHKVKSGALLFFSSVWISAFRMRIGCQFPIRSVPESGSNFPVTAFYQALRTLQRWVLHRIQ